MFFVFLDSQEVNCPIGVHEFERKEGVKLFISVKVQLSHVPDMDHIYHALDYTQLVDIVNEVSSQERQLLETLAADIAAEINTKSSTAIENIHIRIEKPQIPHDRYNAKSCGIEYILNC
ncbi:MAG: dihydroneopterin aldolase [Sphingomonadales bacterium]|nr:dihydroneopterin aldolase [Sphingomonadales bacterium]